MAVLLPHLTSEYTIGKSPVDMAVCRPIKPVEAPQIVSDRVGPATGLKVGKIARKQRRGRTCPVKAPPGWLHLLSACGQRRISMKSRHKAITTEPTNPIVPSKYTSLV